MYRFGNCVQSAKHKTMEMYSFVKHEFILNLTYKIIHSMQQKAMAAVGHHPIALKKACVPPQPTFVITPTAVRQSPRDSLIRPHDAEAC